MVLANVSFANLLGPGITLTPTSHGPNRLHLPINSLSFYLLTIPEGGIPVLFSGLGLLSPQPPRPKGFKCTPKNAFFLPEVLNFILYL